MKKQKRPDGKPHVGYWDLIKQVSKKGETTRNRKFLEKFFKALKVTVWQQTHFVIPGLVTFNVRPHKAREVRNPITGEPMPIPKRAVVKARAAQVWRSR